MKGQFNDSPAYVVDKYGQREMRSGRDLHESDCLYRTHNGKCDCALGTTINDAATRMRDRCVERMKGLRDEWESKRNELEPLSKMRNRYDAAFCAANEAIKELQSLTLDQAEQKQ